MTVTHSILSALLVAIDTSKDRHQMLIGIQGKKRRCRLTITDTLDDFQRLPAVLASYKLSVRIRFEATGNISVSRLLSLAFSSSIALHLAMPDIARPPYFDLYL